MLKVKNNQKNIQKYNRLFQKCGAKSRNGYYVMTFVEYPKKIIKKLKHSGVQSSCYRVEYERASNYRQTFFARTKGPYTCRYCNRFLRKDLLVVDHIIPVAKVQKSAWARLLLHLEGCDNVNHIRNLAPACQRCNSRKLDKLGLWPLRGWLGKYKWYWALLCVLKILVAVLAVAGLVFVLQTCFPDFSPQIFQGR